jgi:hypothetical protein
MVSFGEEISSDDLVGDGDVAPKGADVVGWTNLLIAKLLADAKPWRSYFRKLAREPLELPRAAISHLSG